MGEAQGKKVNPSAIAAQAIEAQPSFGQIKPSEANRCRHDDCARNCYCLSPTFGGYTNVREAECGIIPSDSSW